MSRPTPAPEGIIFPQNEKGERSTGDVAKKIFAATFNAMGETQLANDVMQERNWRYKYNKYILKHVEKSLKSPESALAAANAGLNYMHENFDFVRGNQTMKLGEAMKNIKGTFSTGFVQGTKPKPSSPELVIPYKGRQLRGADLIAQVEKWSKYGTIEPSAAEAIIMVAKNNKWVDLSDRYFVILGAGSAMGPYLVLIALGANIIGIDLDRAPIWKRLIGIARESCGTLTFPLKKDQNECKTDDELFENAGSNLISQAPEINNWLSNIYPNKPLTIGCYVYLDGDNHVKVVLACDAIMKGMTENRKLKAGVAYLCTPTDIHVIPDEARRAALSNYSSMSLENIVLLPFKFIPGQFVKNAMKPITSNDGQQFSIVDGLLVPQGPNYALAKRMQHWRAIVARAQGSFASSHIAPSTSTASVVHNKTFAWAYDGLPYFRPIEIFSQETSNAVMTSILVHDLNNTKAVANPDVPLHNPLELFKYNSFNGGVWRSGYTFASLGGPAVIIHFIKVLRPVIFVLLALSVYFGYNKFFKN